MMYIIYFNMIFSSIIHKSSLNRSFVAIYMFFISWSFYWFM